MLVSFDWLKQYVAVSLSPAALMERLMLAGLNDDGMTAVDADFQLNIEVTSNRPDCLGHLGVAREASVLLGVPLLVPTAKPQALGGDVSKFVRVRLDAPDLCPRYTARLIRGVTIKPSPAWMVKRLATIGCAAINNVVDITNYVLFECGQPLHAFDFAKIAGGEIIVRRATDKEPFKAINHKDYLLDPSICAIADAKQVLALAGVMGGATSEVTDATRDVLIEAAEFDSLATRSTARKLTLQSDSSYRFERALDPGGVDYASRRACELILELAGGELCAGVVDVGRKAVEPKPITLRSSQLKRVLGIDVPSSEVRRILIALGLSDSEFTPERIVATPPTWRRDLEREIDLVEEVARIHGYDHIPENTSVPMFPSHRTDADRVLGKVRSVLTTAGYDEAMTLSAVDETLSNAFSPWSDQPALAAAMPVLRRATQLRRSLVPSLLAARRTNEALSNDVIELFEIAKVYLPNANAAELPREPRILGLTSGGDFRAVKGVVEQIVSVLDPTLSIIAEQTTLPLADPAKCAKLTVRANGETRLLGYVATLSPAGLKPFELRGTTTIAEIDCEVLFAITRLIPQYAPLPVYPAITRDLNFVVDEPVTWGALSKSVTQAAGDAAEAVTFIDEYRNAERLGADKKSLLLSITLRRADGTLTSEEADATVAKVVSAIGQEHGGQLRA